MPFKQAGYQAALADMGLIKEAVSLAPLKAVGSKVKGLFSRAPKKAPVPMAGQNYSPAVSGMADDAGANAFRADLNAANPAQSPLLQNVNFESAAIPRTTPQGTVNNIRGLKNNAAPPAAPPSSGQGFTPSTANAPPGSAAAPPGQGFTPAAANVPAEAGAAAKPGLLARIRNNPLKSTALAGAGLGGVGYVMGAGAPPPGQPMQQYDPQMQMQAGYQ